MQHEEVGVVYGPQEHFNVALERCGAKAVERQVHLVVERLNDGGHGEALLLGIHPVVVCGDRVPERWMN